jgi:hypothetical protein
MTSESVPPKRSSEAMPVVDLPPRTTGQSLKPEGEELPIEDLPPRKNVTGG